MRLHSLAPHGVDTLCHWHASNLFHTGQAFFSRCEVVTFAIELVCFKPYQIKTYYRKLLLQMTLLIKAQFFNIKSSLH
jgi:hypothetical protein